MKGLLEAQCASRLADLACPNRHLHSLVGNEKGKNEQTTGVNLAVSSSSANLQKWLARHWANTISPLEPNRNNAYRKSPTDWLGWAP